MFHRPPAPRLTPYVFGCALAALLALGCSKGGDDASPVAGASNPASGLPASPDVWGSGVLAVVTGVINPDGTLGLDAPPRSGLAVGDTFDLDATEFFTQGPCYDCIEVTGISRDGAGNLRLPFAVRHPFGLGVNGRYDLHLFDARGILILPGSSPFPGLGSAPVNVGVNTIADQVLTGDPELVLNADGYTTYFDYHAANPAYGPPRTIPGNLNPFKRYFVDENPGTFDHANPAGWNVFPMGSPTETQEFILDGVRVASLGTVPFAFVLDACYGQSATRATRAQPTYFLPEFNRKEAWDVQAQVISSNLQVGDKTSKVIVEVTAKDWQQLAVVNGGFPANNNAGQVRFSSKVKQVDVTIPGVTATKDTVTEPFSGGGTNLNPFVFRVTCNNDLQFATETTLYGLAAVRDELYQVGESNGGPVSIPGPPPGGVSPREGLDIRDYSAYQFFPVTVGPAVDDPPAADLSMTNPRQIMTGTQITLNGQLSADDIGITTWEFDPEGTGAWVDNSAQSQPWLFQHTYTTPPNTLSAYDAALRVTDTVGQQHVATVRITVSTTPDSPPVARITAPTPWSVGTGTTVTLDGSTSSDDFGITKYEWNPGDGTGWIDNGLDPTLDHNFTAPGMTTLYTVQLRVTDAALQTHTASKVIEVVVTDDPPVADLQVTPVSPGTDAPRDVILDASGSTDDFGVAQYRFDPGDGTGWSPWQPGATFPYTYIPFVDTDFTARVEVRDGSLQTDIDTATVTVTVPGGCLVSGVSGPTALNVGETATYTVNAMGILPGGYQWSESDPDIQFVGATNGPSVMVQGVGESASTGSTTFSFIGNGGVCSYDVDITVYDLAVAGPSHTRQYVNISDTTAPALNTDEYGTLVTITAITQPIRAGVTVTFNFTDPDEPQYQVIAGSDPAPSLPLVETDTDPDDNRGDIRRSDGSANGLPGGTKYQNGFQQPGPIYASSITAVTNAFGQASAIFKTSRFGGDNYRFSAMADPAGNGVANSITVTDPDTLTVWRKYGVPVYSMWDAGTTNEFFYMPVFNLVNTQFEPAYIEFNFSTELSPSAPTPNGYGGMLYTSPLNATFAAQTSYINTASNYNAPGEQYSPAEPNIPSIGINEYNPSGVIGLCTYSTLGSVPPLNQNVSSKPITTTDYTGVARGRMNGFGMNVTSQNKVLTHELGHAMGLNHSNDGEAGDPPNTTKHGANGVGIMRPSVNTGEAALWTASEVDFLRGIDTDLVTASAMRGPWYEGP